LGKRKTMTISSRLRSRGSRSPRSFWKTSANADGLFWTRVPSSNAMSLKSGSSGCAAHWHVRSDKSPIRPC
jgi:hypothetical protein